MTAVSNRWVQMALCVALGTVFVYAGWQKLADRMAFADSVAAFRLIPPLGVSLVALGLPVLEVLAALLLISGWQRRAAALTLLGLTAVFSLALGSALIRGLSVECGCFGKGNLSAWHPWLALGRNVCLLTAAGVVYGVELRKEHSRRLK